MIAEAGITGVTHRAVAARAHVPLGSTTYYFPTLADLVASALEEELRARLRAWSAEPDLDGYLVDARLAHELYVAAAHAPELRPVAARWIEGLRALCTRVAGEPELGHALAALVDGALSHALATGEPLDRARLATAAGVLLSRRTGAGST